MKTAAATALGLRGSLLEGVTVAGRVVDVVVEFNEEELERRRRIDTEVIPSRDDLRLLAHLPYREAVSLEDIDTFSRALLGSASSALVKMTHTSVERLWTPALNITGFLVMSGEWKSAISRVSLFAADAPRGVAYTGTGSLADGCARARELGVGFARIVGAHVEVLVEPERHLIRHDEIRWALAETMFEVWKRRMSSAEVPPSAEFEHRLEAHLCEP